MANAPASADTSTSFSITGSSIRACSRKNRVYVLRNFLLATYGDYVHAGDVVLDVAGGKGTLSWLLTNVDDLVSVVVDPRLVQDTLTRSVEYLCAHPAQAQERAIPSRPTHQPLAQLIPKLKTKTTFVQPRHLRILMDQDLVSALCRVREKRSDEATNHGDGWETFWREATRRGREAQPLGYREQAPEKTRPVDEVEIDNAQEALELLQRVRLIVGFHPDQATDACIDLALELGVPYCVVPCCVFPSQFPDRRLSNGSKVRSYAQLIQYLQEKDPTHVQTCVLPFHQTETARKIVLYTLPSDYSKRKSSTP